MIGAYKLSKTQEKEQMEDLEERVLQFNTLQLPGQPMAMHMGTSYLVNDLWAEVKRLRDDAKKGKEDGE